VIRTQVILDIPETANFLRLSEKTIRRLIERRKLRASKVGNRWRIRRRDAEDYLDATANIPSDDGSDATPIEPLND
jgi:excisionase family DNA binding protein